MGEKYWSKALQVSQNSVVEAIAGFIKLSESNLKTEKFNLI